MEKNILVIDDEEEVRFFLKRILERRGFSVVAAQDGEEGLEKITNSNIRIVLCDILMPKLGGLEFLKKVHEYNLSVEIIMITAQSTLDNCVESVEKGACAYLKKPLKTTDLISAIERAQRNILEKKEIIEKALKL